jgi:hypothetical protein
MIEYILIFMIGSCVGYFTAKKIREINKVKQHKADITEQLVVMIEYYINHRYDVHDEITGKFLDNLRWSVLENYEGNKIDGGYFNWIGKKDHYVISFGVDKINYNITGLWKTPDNVAGYKLYKCGAGDQSIL